MANPEHLNRLAQGVNSWNALRRRDPFTPDLQDEDVSRHLGVHEREDIRMMSADLRGVNLSNANLIDSTLRDTDLSNAFIGNAQLNRAKLMGSRFDGSTFVGAGLRGANLMSASLANAKLFDTDLTGALLLGTDVKGTQFWKCDLSNTHLYSANLTGTDFIRSRPWQANLFGSPGQNNIESAPLDICTIKELADLAKVSRQLQSAYGDKVVLYYRGESRHFDELTPAVLRKPKQGQSSLRASESEMLNELLTRQPEAFQGLNSALPQWVMAQHHLLNTRLLDITRNPQVALFFSCNEFQHEDGRIHVFAVPTQIIKPFDSDAVNVIANFAKLPRPEQNMLLGKTEDDVADDAYPDNAGDILGGIEFYKRAQNHLHSIARREQPNFREQIDIRDFFRVLVVEPQQMFERIRAQSGAFLISAFHERFERAEVLRVNEHTPIYAHHVLTVPNVAKETLLGDLRVFNVTMESLFPSVDHTAQAITERYQRRST